MWNCTPSTTTGSLNDSVGVSPPTGTSVASELARFLALYSRSFASCCLCASALMAASSSMANLAARSVSCSAAAASFCLRIYRQSVLKAAIDVWKLTRSSSSARCVIWFASEPGISIDGTTWLVNQSWEKVTICLCSQKRCTFRKQSPHTWKIISAPRQFFASF